MNHIPRTITIAAILASLLTVSDWRSTAEAAPSAVKERIAAVENNLSYYFAIKNDTNAAMNITRRMADLHVPGVSIAVIHQGRLDWARGYGVTRVGADPVTTDTIFGAASISKALTAVAVMHFAQEGKINLDANVNQYLKRWKIPDNQFTQSKKVTVRQLLGHTSGIGTHNGWVFDATKDQVPTLLQELDGIKSARTPAVRVEGEPGSSFHYANGGYLVLQLLLEDISGKPFWQVMRDTVLSPIGMRNSTFESPLPPRFLTKTATCYNGSTPVEPAHFMLPGAAAGGLWTTPSDLAKFVIELQKEYAGTSHRVLNRQTVRQMIERGLGPNPKRHWGLGVEVGGSSNNPYFEHGGSGYWETEMIGYLNGDGVIILSNGGGGASLIQEVARSVARVYGWPDYKPIPKATVSVDPSTFDQFVGVYGFMTITRNGNKLMAEIPKGGQKVPLFAASPSEFFLRDSPTTIRFNAGSDGRSQSADFITDIAHFNLKRN